MHWSLEYVYMLSITANVCCLIVALVEHFLPSCLCRCGPFYHSYAGNGSYFILTNISLLSPGLHCFVDLGCVCQYHPHTACTVLQYLSQLWFSDHGWDSIHFGVKLFKCGIQNSRNTVKALTPLPPSAPVFTCTSETRPWWQCVVVSEAWAPRRSVLSPKMSCRCPWPWRTSPSHSGRSPSPSLLLTWKNTKPGWPSLGQCKECFRPRGTKALKRGELGVCITVLSEL